MNARSNLKTKPKPFGMTKKISTILFFAVLIASFSTLAQELSSHQHEKLVGPYLTFNFQEQFPESLNEDLLTSIQNEQMQTTPPVSTTFVTDHSKIPERLPPNILAGNTSAMPDVKAIMEQLKSLKKEAQRLGKSPPSMQTTLSPPSFPPMKYHPKLHPLLNELQEKSRKITEIYNDTMRMFSSCNELDRLSQGELKKLVQLYSEKENIHIPENFLIPLIFCKETQADYKAYGWHRTEFDDFSHQISGSIKALWQSHFLIEVAKRKGHLLRFVLFPVTDFRKAVGKSQVSRYSGKITRNIGIDNIPTKVPIDGYRDTGYGSSIILAPEEDYQPQSFIYREPPSKWPENIPSRYRLYFSLPQIFYYSSHRNQVLSINSCDMCAFPPSGIFITIKSLGDAINRGMLSVRVKNLEGESPLDSKPTITGEVEVYSPNGNLVKVIPDESGQRIVGEVLRKNPGGEWQKDVKNRLCPDCVESDVTINVNIPRTGCEERQNGGTGAVALLGDCLDHGGFIISGEKKVFGEGRLIVRAGDTAFCLKHGITKISENISTSVYSGNKRVARVGDNTECGATIISGSLNIFAGK